MLFCADLPKALAGVDMRLEPGAIRYGMDSRSRALILISVVMTVNSIGIRSPR